MVRNMSAWKWLKKPLLFGGYLSILAAAAYSTFGHVSIFKLEEQDSREYECQEQKPQKQLAELEERKVSP